MTSQPDFFRDFGIIPNEVPPPPQTIRASFSTGHVIGQYAGTCFMSGLGLLMTVVALLAVPLPYNLLAALFPLALFGTIVYLATRNDYAWVELCGDTLRAKHLYTGRIVERPIDEIDDLLTLVFQVRTLETMIAEAWLGRIRGVMIRFRDRRTPLQVCRADPAMTSAKELIEAIVYRMNQKRPVEAEVINLEGKPLVRRIFWKTAETKW